MKNYNMLPKKVLNPPLNACTVTKMATHPACDTRPKVGLKPTTPHRAAGIRTDPASKTHRCEFFHYLIALEIHQNH